MNLVNLVSYKHSLTMVQLGVLSATKKLTIKSGLLYVWEDLCIFSVRWIKKFWTNNHENITFQNLWNTSGEMLALNECVGKHKGSKLMNDTAKNCDVFQIKGLNCPIRVIWKRNQTTLLIPRT